MVTTTYDNVRLAYQSLIALSTGQAGKENWTLVPELPFKTLLKIKRMVGVLEVVVRYTDTLIKEVIDKYKPVEDEPNPEFNKAIQDLLLKTADVGCDTLSPADFENVSSGSVLLIGVLTGLGPFWSDE